MKQAHPPTREPNRAATGLSRHAPAIVCGALALAAITDAALATRHWLNAGKPIATSPAAGLPVRAVPIGVEAIQAAHLFGAAAVSSAAQVAATDASLIVVGTIALPDPHGGFAIAGPTREAARICRVGGTLPGEYTLSAVYPDRIVVSRDGATLIYFLPHAALAGLFAMEASAPSVAPEPDPDVLKKEAEMHKDPLNKMVNGQWTFGGISPRIRYERGRFAGVILAPVGPGSEIAERAGISPLDLLTAVNGRPLPPEPAQLMASLRELEGIGPVEFAIRRSTGKVESVFVSLPKVDHSAE